ncbi:MAG: cytidylate kinase-like family protein [Clostridia bacterium]|nr:cytidylate kinase-like family protein [Clostridia bacterium]MBR2969278.1 cytidylate kinase-like family protein [Clostridia bacterium]
MKKIITVGREFGSGGRELGRRLAEALGVAYYDKEIIVEIAKRTELSEQYVNNIVENKPLVSYPIHVGVSFNTGNFAPVQQKNNIYYEQEQILKEMAEKAPCVIVGRCADHILREFDPFRIFVYSDLETKMRRCRSKGIGEEEISDKDLKKYIQRVDKNRAEYYEFYTGKKWGEKLNYDLCINTTGTDIKMIASVLAKML